MKITWEEAVKRFRNKHGDRYEYDSSSFTNMENKMNIICRKHGVFSQSPEKHSTGRGCPKCKWYILREAFTPTWVEVVNTFRKIHGDRYDYPEQEYINSRGKIRVICKEHGEFITNADKHSSGSGCRECAGNNPKTYDEWISVFRDVHGFRYTYPLQKITASRHITIICYKHGEFQQGVNKHAYRSRGCPICRESKGEKSIAAFLDNNNIKYERQKKFDDCKNKFPLSFDFFLPDYKILIEYDGEQHFREVSHWGGKEQYDISQHRDKIKTEWVSSHPYFMLLRIRYDEDVSSRLHQFLQGVQHPDASTSTIHREVSATNGG
jgi:very-short-patch-repair endonuclease